jgi:hypothetical protein
MVIIQVHVCVYIHTLYIWVIVVTNINYLCSTCNVPSKIFNWHLTDYDMWSTCFPLSCGLPLSELLKASVHTASSVLFTIGKPFLLLDPAIYFSVPPHNLGPKESISLLIHCFPGWEERSCKEGWIKGVDKHRLSLNHLSFRSST